MTNTMKTKTIILSLAAVIFAAASMSAQDRDFKVTGGEGKRYEGAWPQGYGVLYSYEDGLVLGTFLKGKPHGKCVCYKPNGEVYWGDFKRGKATGNGRIYRDNGIVVSGHYKNGRYHGVDTLYRSNGTINIGRYRNGRYISKIADSRDEGVTVEAVKPGYPQVNLRRRQETFLNELEVIWQERNLMIVKRTGLITPKFQGGDVEDFAFWVNSQVVYPERPDRESRTVIVEFTVMKDGSVQDVLAVFGSDVVLNEEAVRVVSSSPKWTPGEQNGEKKNVRLSVPVMFTF